MKMKKFTAMVSSAVMVFSLLAGISIAPKSIAAVTSELQKEPGLYVSEYVPWEWDDEAKKDFIRTDTDQNGNTVLKDWDDQSAVPYQCADDPDVFTYGIKDGWGPSFRAAGEDLWFDYYDGTKLTHVTFDQLSFTKLDGSAVTTTRFSKHPEDDRVVCVSADEDKEPVLVTYSGADTNNKVCLTGSLRHGLYSSTKASVSTVLDEANVYEKGTTVLYYHIIDSTWRDGRYIADAKSLIRCIRYYDKTKEQEVELTQSGDLSKYITVKQVSKDETHPVFKFLIKSIPGTDGWANVDLSFKTYNIEDGKDNAWDNGDDIHINFIEGTAPAPAKGTTDTIGGLTYKVNGNKTVTVLKGANKASVTIPATVSIDGTSCKVTAIEKNAFKGCGKVKKLTVKSTTIKTVGSGALKALKKDAVAKVPKAKKKAYKKLFKKGGFKGKVK